MKLYFFTQKLGSLRRLFRRPLTIFLTLYSVIVYSAIIKKKKHASNMNYKPGEETIALSPLPEKSTEKKFSHGTNDIFIP